MRLPTPRGPLSAELTRVLRGDRRRLPALTDRAQELVGTADGTDVLAHEDLQLSLHDLYELHYRGFDDVDPDAEWCPGLLTVRALLEDLLEKPLRALAPVPEPTTAPDVAASLTALVADDEGPSLSAFLSREATAEQFREFVVHRSIYELKEADPHTWAIPRLTGRAKTALAEVQFDEYGGGRPERMHATLYARAMRALGLDDAYGRHVDQVPAITLATVNSMSLFGLHRRLRGAVVGHLAAFEMTSTVPNRRYGTGLRRLGFGADATWFFDEHVEADAVHEQLAAHDMCGGLIADEPDLLADVLLGAAAAMHLERRFAEHVLGAWSAGRSSLRAPGLAVGPVS
ncbi:iron-containing redox enzyme family protein [Blastococcus mobilis]|uniref:Iron-containing redox enzyme n=1 Tax=Blastococcus mobilis TaxID=1938746 RepID=A0A239A108_9ACTN|nr:iron-containing redox enzyme family protein [Blastococcus mobilis]SNR88583.1 Iron-containing redox enzyme [Blastococcus mobilis]